MKTEETTVVQVDNDIRELIDLFMNQRKLDIETLRRAVVARDYEAVRKTGHSLAGAGSSYGFHRVSEIGAVLEAAAKSGSDARIAQGVDDLEHYMRQVIVKFV